MIYDSLPLSSDATAAAPLMKTAMSMPKYFALLCRRAVERAN
jgi:hypothetical protein